MAKNQRVFYKINRRKIGLKHENSHFLTSLSFTHDVKRNERGGKCIFFLIPILSKFMKGLENRISFLQVSPTVMNASSKLRRARGTCQS